MTRKEVLESLLAKVEDGEFEVRHWLAVTAALGLCPDNRHNHFINAYSGSLSAAKALHDALIDGWGWEIAVDAEDGFSASVWMRSTCISAGGTSPSIAWLIAILKAMISQERS